MHLLEFCVQIGVMRKKSKYRPKGVLINPVAYVLEGMKPVKHHDDFLLTLKIKNHDALTALTQGRAVRWDIDVLINMVNVTEALYRLGFGDDYGDVVKDGLNALLEIGKRGAQSGRFVVKAQEMTALNTAMELHDAQMELVTIKDMERAIDIVNKEFAQGKTKKIVEKGIEK